MKIGPSIREHGLALVVRRFSLRSIQPIGSARAYNDRMQIQVRLADGLQVAALGPYGNDWIATPNLDRLATQTVVFDQHFADFPGKSDPAWNAKSVELQRM